MKLNKLTILTLGVIIASLMLSCSKKSDDNNAGAALLLASAVAVPATGPGCDRTKKECVISLLRDKVWYMKGSTQVPRNVLGHQESFINTIPLACVHKTRFTMVTGTSGSDLDIATRTVLGTISGGTCNKDTPSSSLAFEGRINIVPVSKNCFDITIAYQGFGQEGRGEINEDGTLLKLEVYNVTSTKTPSGHRCANGAVGERNASLTPDSVGCDNTELVCQPSNDNNYNSVQIYDLDD